MYYPPLGQFTSIQLEMISRAIVQTTRNSHIPSQAFTRNNKAFSAFPLAAATRTMSSTTSRRNVPKADLADNSAKPLYASESTLPQLPVPTLSSTFHKYLETLTPLLSQEELANSEKLVKDFLSSDIAQTLQARLEARASENESWLSDWWNEAAYMGYRDRLVPNSNYFYVHKKGISKGKNQVQRAAEMVRAVREFRDLVVKELLEPEKVKGKPLASSSYHQM